MNAVPPMKYPKSSNLTLKQMEIRANNDEGLYRTLTGLDHTDDDSVLSYDRCNPPPAKKVALRKTGDPPAGTKICSGKIWIEGKEQDVTAYRST